MPLHRSATLVFRHTSLVVNAPRVRLDSFRDVAVLEKRVAFRFRQAGLNNATRQHTKTRATIDRQCKPLTSPSSTVAQLRRLWP